MNVAIIGAGVSGLTAIKHCIECNLNPICFERSTDIGGLWRYKSEVIAGEPSVQKCTVIQSSKEPLGFSDFPPPKEFPNYMHHTKVLEYLRLYADHFDLLKHVQFNTTVLSVKKHEDFDLNGQWIVRTKGFNQDETVKAFDAVILGIGHHVEPFIPRLPSLGTFGGRIIHSRSYKDRDEFANKRVVIVGLGSTAAEIAVHLAHTASKVFVSSRSGAWLKYRLGQGSLPGDLFPLNRYNNFLNDIMPRSWVHESEEKQMNLRIDHEAFGLKPAHHVSEGRLVINDELPVFLQAGLIVLKPDIIGVHDKTGLVFQDGSEEPGIDVVIMCTGFRCNFDILEEGLIPATEENEVELFLNIFPPGLKHPTLAVAGLIHDRGPTIPSIEMQTRVISEVLSGHCKLPSTATMELDIQEKKELNKKRYIASRRVNLLVEFLEYLDELAELIGVKPNLMQLAYTDPRLAYAVFFGPFVNYQFRLIGRHSWPGAREAIFTAMDRVKCGMNPRIQ